jgi:NAD(P) transhydrogenase subunit beta
MLTALPQLTIVIADLAATFLFLFGLKRMSTLVTAPSGIAYAGIWMVVAVVASFLYVLSVGSDAHPSLLVNSGLAVAALAVGGGLAWRSGQKAALTTMPQMVALLNGAAAAIAAIVLLGGASAPATLVVPNWSCHGYVPVSQLIYAAFRSNAKGLLPPSDEWRRRGL